MRLHNSAYAHAPTDSPCLPYLSTMQKFVRFFLLLLAAAVVIPAIGQPFSNAEHLAKSKPIEITYGYSPMYNGGASNALVDGVLASATSHKSYWQGYLGDDLIATIDLGAETEIAEISARFLRNHAELIFVPRTVEIETSKDGKKYRNVARFEHFETMPRQGSFARTFTQKFNGQRARYVRIRAENVAFVPEWNVFAGDQAWLMCDEIVVSDTQTNENAEMRGVWWNAQPYEPTALPQFDAVRDELPQPVLNDSLLLAMYWWCWEKAFSNLRTPEPGSSLVAPYPDESFSSNLFQWDTHFMLMYWKYAHHIFPAIEAHDNFYANQHSSGYMCRELKEPSGDDFIYESVEHSINPPLFARTEWEWFKHTGDPSRFERLVPVLERYGQWIDGNRVFPGTAHLLYWNTRFGSGMDNSPRKGLAWVDMSSQMAEHYEILSRMCLFMEDEQRYTAYSELAHRLRSTINHFMWSEEDGLYYDLDPMNNHEKIATAACFWPMWTNVADSAQCDALLENLLDNEQFLTEVPFTTLSKQHHLYTPNGNYWRGSVWAPTNYMIISGMHRAGYHERAALASEAYLAAMAKAFEETGTVWENYKPETAKPGSQAKPDFVGWSALGPIALLIESVIGVEVDAPVKTINWRIHRLDEHGVQNLRMGKNTVNLLFEPANGSARVTVESTEPMLLNITWQGSETMHEVSPGKMVIELN